MFKIIIKLLRYTQENWPWFAGLISLSMLATAHFFETFMNLYPCPLCLHQREVYWVALTVSILAIIAKKFSLNSAVARAFDALLAVVFLSGAVIAGFHAGVELHWWKGLPECSGAAKATFDGDLLSALSKPLTVPKCEDVTWSFLGLSMAGWNMVMSLALAIWSCICALKGDTGATLFTDTKEEV